MLFLLVIWGICRIFLKKVSLHGGKIASFVFLLLSVIGILHLAFTGAIRDQILDVEELACELLGILREAYEDRLRERYKLTEALPEDSYELLTEVGRKRGMLIAGGEVNTERAATMLLDEYREGKLGTITLEFPEK